MQNVEEMTAGRVHMGPGTIYTALNTLVKKGLIRQTESQDDADSRRKVYEITDDGRQVLSAEMQRLAELLENGRRRIHGGRT
ncbi:MAG: PadR family transcriptional regulator [Alicyclobacillus shizuokensis]|nr:PadR family transcriptional regulator [Alicyclobacillus shizuokensis]